MFAVENDSEMKVNKGLTNTEAVSQTQSRADVGTWHAARPTEFQRMMHEIMFNSATSSLSLFLQMKAFISRSFCTHVCLVCLVCVCNSL